MGWDDVIGRLDADLLLMTDALRQALLPLKANMASQ
jgi:recombination associated protein RdgC